MTTTSISNCPYSHRSLLDFQFSKLSATTQQTPKPQKRGRKSNTYPRRSTQIDQHLTLLQKPKLLIQLYKLERSTGAISLFFGEFVPFVQTAFAVLLLDRHPGAQRATVANRGLVWGEGGLAPSREYGGGGETIEGVGIELAVGVARIFFCGYEILAHFGLDLGESQSEDFEVGDESGFSIW